ncbi:hypothetical protein AMS68_007469 [Peltaster fructicola]|uniref:Phospholipid scramblase n=1 Tax=Peltaster fructicola TaxID=286661 RepID=A0A6H0Y4J7_9PEZI|nr:hypothetical protein AMS68_007469 [Peltaster fructicola]
MTSLELSINMVRQSMRALERAQTQRMLAAIQRKQLSSSTMPPIAGSAQTRRPQWTAPARIRWQSTKSKPIQDEQAQLASTIERIQDPDLVTEVNMKPDPYGVLPHDHPALPILGQSSLIVSRQIEMLNVFVGYEQANRYTIMNGEKEIVGYIAEEDHALGRTLARQAARVHRSFTAHVFDKEQREVLRIHRPFSYLNTKIRIYDPVPPSGYERSGTGAMSAGGKFDFNEPVKAGHTSPLKLEDMRIIGECQSQWTPTRRKYSLSTNRHGDPSCHDTVTLKSTAEDKIEAQMMRFSKIDEPALSLDFTVRDSDDWIVGKVSRSLQGFAREAFTDSGVYLLKLDSAAHIAALEDAQGKEVARYEVPGLTLDQRAVMIATAVSIDFDYFSLKSSQLTHAFPLAYGLGGGAAEGGAVAEASAGAVGAAGRGVAGAGAMESGIAGAGTIAGYEAMQRGIYGDQSMDDASPQAAQPPPQTSNTPQQSSDQSAGDVWSTDQDPWSEASKAAEESSGSWLDTITDWFNS